jgi:phenylacetate-CoA ligase
LPPLGDFACANPVDVVRVQSHLRDDRKPLVLAYTAEDLETSARIGARAYWAAGARPDDVLLHCLNYSFYTGGLVDHDSLEETGATMVPVGLGQSARVLELWADLRPTALFSTLTYPLYLAEAAQENGLEPRALGLRKLIVAGEPGGQLAGTRKRLEELWGASMRDTYGLSDVWGTFAAECEEHDGLHFSGQDGVLVELIDPESEEPVGIEPG